MRPDPEDVCRESLPLDNPRREAGPVTARPGAFIFDLDGTLVDSRLDIALAANAVRRHFGLAELPEPVLTGYVGDGVARLLERALGHDAATGRAGPAVDPARLAEGQEIFAAHYGEHLLDNTGLYAGVRGVLAHLRRVPLHVATNKPRGFAVAILDGLGLDGIFRRIVGGDDAPARKPDPAHLAACLEGLAVPPAQVVVVGDSPNDVLAARALGAVSVGCTYGLVDAARVRDSGPDHLIADVTDLAALFPG